MLLRRRYSAAPAIRCHPPDSERSFRAAGLIPGITTKLPKRYTRSKESVKRILLRSSSILNIFLMVSISFFITEKLEFTTLPCCASIAAAADFENACAVTSSATESVPLPRILTRSFFEMKPASINVSTSMLFRGILGCRSSRTPRLIPLYSTLFRFVKPYLGKRLCKGIWPPSKPNFEEYPERDLAPLRPRVAVPPCPDP